MTDNDNLVTDEQIQQAAANIVQRVQSGVDSVSVDGVSTKYQSLNEQLEALKSLQKLQAARNPLGCVGIYQVRSGH